MKVIVLLLALIALSLAQSEALIACIEKNCPDQYAKCKKTSGCEDKLRKCATKCGEKLNQTCWTLCLGFPGAAADVALCAVKQGCIAGDNIVEKVGLTLMGAINEYSQTIAQSLTQE